jgi:hypothetical protein
VRFEYSLTLDPQAPDGLAHIGLIDHKSLRIRSRPDGKKEGLTASDKKPKSGSKPPETKPSAKPDGLSETHIRDPKPQTIIS